MPDECGVSVPEEVDEYNREDRIEAIYDGWGAREMAERIVALEDELGADVDGMCTGMHADVAEAQSEIERLVRALRLSEAKVGGAALYVGQANARSDMLENAMTAYEGIADERDRYQLAWTSARRRAKLNRWYADSDLRFTRMMWSDALRNLSRYRLAWLSARRRAVVEANYGQEAMDLMRAQVSQLKAELERRPPLVD
jgi:hypothetical protein